MAAAAAGDPVLDNAALKVWCLGVDARLGNLNSAIAEVRAQVTGADVVLGRTIEQARAALNEIVDGVRAELAGAQRRFQQDGDLRAAQLELVAEAAQGKFVSMAGALGSGHVAAGGSPRSG